MTTPDPLPSLDAAQAGAAVDALLPMLGIPVDPAWRDAIAGNLAATANAARLVLDFPLEDEVDPAPVFRP